MPRPLEVRVSPIQGSVLLGETASFACDTQPMEEDLVLEFSWGAAVQIANETRYQFNDDRRQIVHITDVQDKDNNTDIVCEVRTATGRKGKGTAKIMVKAGHEKKNYFELWYSAVDLKAISDIRLEPYNSYP